MKKAAKQYRDFTLCREVNLFLVTSNRLVRFSCTERTLWSIQQPNDFLSLFRFLYFAVFDVMT